MFFFASEFYLRTLLKLVCFCFWVYDVHPSYREPAQTSALTLQSACNRTEGIWCGSCNKYLYLCILCMCVATELFVFHFVLVKYLKVFQQSNWYWSYNPFVNKLYMCCSRFSLFSTNKLFRIFTVDQPLPVCSTIGTLAAKIMTHFFSSISDFSNSYSFQWVYFSLKITIKIYCLLYLFIYVLSIFLCISLT